MGNGSQFTQTGGSGTLGNITQTSGTAITTIMQGTLATNNIYVGGDSNGARGAGTLNIGYGAFLTNAGTLKVHSTGTFIISSNGTLSTSVLDISSAGSFSFTGGSITINNGSLLGKASGFFFDGTTTQATLTLKNSTVSAGTVTVDQLGVLSGSGTINGAIILKAGSDLYATAGANSAPLYASSMSFTGEAYFLPTLNAPGSSPALQASGSISLGGGISHLIPSTTYFNSLPSGTVYTLITAAGGVNGTFAGLPENSTVTLGSSKFSIDYLANGGDSVTLTAMGTTAPPPPTTTATDVTLLVNPTNGRVTLISALQTGQSVITAYFLNSPSGSLLRFSQDANGKYLGTAMENNPAVFYTASDGLTYNRWTSIKNTSSFIAEGFGLHYRVNDDSTWTNYTLAANGYALGTLFKRLSSGGMRDLVFQWNDSSLNAYTSVVNYVGAPEPGSVSLMAMGSMTLLARRCRRVKRASA